MKRFYETVGVEQLEGETLFRVQLDTRTIKTPARHDLRVPTRALADAIADEWRAQGDEVVLASMPLTRLASGAIDRIAVHRADVIDEVAAYAETDLLCYRADRPVALSKRQYEIWQPVLDWVEQRYQAKFATTVGVVPITQSPVALEATRAAIAAHDDMMLGALHAVAHASGSVILALALVDDHIDAPGLVAASQLDERFQIEQWGEDAEAAERRAALAAAIAASARFIALLRRTI
jgi:chaperone required for assembly of F1-ATPase